MSAGYPTTAYGTRPAAVRPPSAGTAESLVLVALILQIIGAVGIGIGMAVVIGFAVVAPFPYAWLASLVFVAIVAVAAVFVYLAYNYSYLRIRTGDYEGAQTPTLAIGVISLFFGIVPGILYIIGYVKLGDAIRERMYPAWYPAPGPPVAPSPPAPR